MPEVLDLINKVTVVTHPQIQMFEELHLCGATGKARTEKKDGKEYLVVPVVALMEGVIFPVNAESPEYVPLETLRQSAASWDGKPVTIGHPRRDGEVCSANDPDIFEEHGIGFIANSRVEGRKMLQDAWLEKDKTRELHPEMFAQLEAGKTIEVSVGSLVLAGIEDGKFGTKRYKAKWLRAIGDHLAFLPGGRGACSVEMGCGTHRAAMHFVAAESIELVSEPLPVLAITVLEDVELNTQMQAVYQAVYDKFKKDVTQSVSSAYPLAVYDDFVIVRNDDGDTLRVSYKMDGGKAVLGEGKKVKQAWVAASEQMRAAAGARHSAGDVRLIQAVHDHAMALGAQCDRGNYKALDVKPEPEIRTLTIRHEGGKWVLYTKDGSRKLGTHNTEGEAMAQEKAIESAKKRRAAELAEKPVAAPCSCQH